MKNIQKIKTIMKIYKITLETFYYHGGVFYYRIYWIHLIFDNKHGCREGLIVICNNHVNACSLIC